MEWYHVWWPWLTSRRVARFVSDSWVSCIHFIQYREQEPRRGQRGATAVPLPRCRLCLCAMLRYTCMPLLKARCTLATMLYWHTSCRQVVRQFGEKVERVEGILVQIIVMWWPRTYVKRKWIYIAPLLKYLTLKALRYGSHSVTCKLHRTCLYLVLSIHQMAHPRLRLRTSNCSLLVIYLPRKDERLSWPRWLVT